MAQRRRTGLAAGAGNAPPADAQAQVADHAGDGAGPVPSLVGPDHLNRRDDLQRIADGRFRVWAIRDKNDWPLGRAPPVGGLGIK